MNITIILTIAAKNNNISADFYNYHKFAEILGAD